MCECGSRNVSLILLTDCSCLGHLVTYECTSMGPGSTVWIVGSLAECEINLRHSQFEPEIAVGRCFGGAVEGMSYQSDGNFYTSRLTLIIHEGLVERLIQCEYDNGVTTTTIGATALRLSSKLSECLSRSLIQYHFILWY